MKFRIGKRAGRFLLPFCEQKLKECPKFFGQNVEVAQRPQSFKFSVKSEKKNFS